MENQVIEITKNELPKIQKKAKTQMVDIRDVWEFKDFNIGGVNIQSHEITERIQELAIFKNLIVVCSNGTRSHIMARVIAKKLPKATIYHLTEGIF